jgi:small GTP-binding protein
MAANLPPQFFELQAKLKTAKTNEEKIKILEEMLSICPKHKGTEKVQKEIKRKIAKLKKALPKKIKREEIFFVKKEGAGQIILLGKANSGKTSLLNTLTQSSFKVADYPFTTQRPTPAMLRFENILIQIVDTPPISNEFKPGWLKNLLLNSDGILVVLDLTQNVKEDLEEIKKILKEWKIETEKVLFLGNKIDLLNKKEALKICQDFRLFPLSAKTNEGTQNLKKEIFKILNVIRVYSKEPGEKPDFSLPFIFKKGTTVIEFVKEIHQNLAQNFKGAKLYQKGKDHPIIVGKDYLLKDGDVIEIIK